MTNGPEFDARVRDFAERSLASLTPERRAECELLASAGEEGCRIFPSEQYPEMVELVYGGAVVGLTTWKWLNDGDDTRPSVSPTEYDGR
jgi:hypothetical protein